MLILAGIIGPDCAEIVKVRLVGRWGRKVVPVREPFARDVGLVVIRETQAGVCEELEVIGPHRLQLRVPIRAARDST